MKRRGVQLLNNKLLLAGVYVDPMNRVLLSEIQKQDAKLALCDLAVRIAGLNARASDDSENISTSDSEGACDEVDFEKMLDQQDHEARSKRRKTQEAANTSSQINKGLTNFKLEFNSALIQVELIDRKSRLNVNEAIKQYPAIVRESAMLAAALPPTQVSVERLFSALRLIRTDQRAAMKEKLTEAILFLRSNY